MSSNYEWEDDARRIYDWRYAEDDKGMFRVFGTATDSSEIYVVAVCAASAEANTIWSALKMNEYTDEESSD